MKVDMVYPEMPAAPRVILLGAMTRAYYEAPDEEKEARILPRFKEVVDQWKALGARVMATLDDDLFMVGPPGHTNYTFYLMFEVERPEIVVTMIQELRRSVNGIRLDRYARFEARIGRPFFLLEAN